MANVVFHQPVLMNSSRIMAPVLSESTATQYIKTDSAVTYEFTGDFTYSEQGAVLGTVTSYRSVVAETAVF